MLVTTLLLFILINFMLILFEILSINININFYFILNFNKIVVTLILYSCTILLDCRYCIFLLLLASIFIKIVAVDCIPTAVLSLQFYWKRSRNLSWRFKATNLRSTECLSRETVSSRRNTSPRLTSERGSGN